MQPDKKVTSTEADPESCAVCAREQAQVGRYEPHGDLSHFTPRKPQLAAHYRKVPVAAKAFC